MSTRADWFPIDSTAPAAIAGLCAELERSVLARAGHGFQRSARVESACEQKDKIPASTRFAIRVVGGLATFLPILPRYPSPSEKLTLFSHAGADSTPRTADRAWRWRPHARVSILSDLLRRLRTDPRTGRSHFLESWPRGRLVRPRHQPRGSGRRVPRPQNGKLYRHRFAQIHEASTDPGSARITHARRPQGQRKRSSLTRRSNTTRDVSARPPRFRSSSRTRWRVQPGLSGTLLG